MTRDLQIDKVSSKAIDDAIKHLDFDFEAMPRKQVLMLEDAKIPPKLEQAMGEAINMLKTAFHICTEELPSNGEHLYRPTSEHTPTHYPNNLLAFCLHLLILHSLRVSFTPFVLNPLMSYESSVCQEWVEQITNISRKGC